MDALITTLLIVALFALLGSGVESVAALNGGYQLAFALGAGCAASAAVIGGVFMRTRAAQASAQAASAAH